MRSHFYLNEDDLLNDWARLAPLFQRVVERACRGEFDVADLKAMALKKRVVIGAFFDEREEPLLAFAFEFRYYPKKTAVNILALGGKRMDEVFSVFLERFKQWAKKAGADFIEASCSPAMTRCLLRYGYVNAYRQLRLDLGGETT
ncbi:hypothetical protein [Oxalobacter paraformigenes]|uniref:N-acetyltransferase domain-containing protein n=1 Tax=Oxalobacter paraformigenes TaxID=556268 RepID=C3X3J9_9BURK|nr:hypothetical protein [Oxalobacter paraformigenes]EEO27785.1 hypothetical protein OFAG_00938 [Oxalobacter paraformigenes]